MEPEQQQQQDTRNNDILLELNHLRKILNGILKPEVLDKLVDLQEQLGADDEQCMLNRFDWFFHNSENKENCNYTRMARHLFIEESSDNVVELIKWLYENWAKEL